MSSEVAVEMNGGRWKQYPAYRDSGVEWLGELPEHWELHAFRRGISFLTDFEANGSFATIKNNVKINNGEPFAWYVRATDLENKRFGNHEENHFCDETTFKFLWKTKLRKGDLLITKRGEIGKVYLMPEIKIPATLAPNLYLIRLNEKLFPPFLYFWFSSNFGKLQLILNNKSTTIGALYKDDIKNCLCLFPPINEQQIITIFLLKKTAKIDNLIIKKEQQIELLQEKRAVLISHAVTKGLDPDVKMKDSGVEWLGEVPEHWCINRAKLLFQEINDRSTNGDETLLTVSHITGVTRRSEKNVNMFMAESLEGYKICEAGDLVINTMWAWMGAMGIASERGIVSPSYNVYRFRTEENEPSFYDNLFRTDQFVSVSISHSKCVWSSRLRLYPESFFEIQIPFPPQEEQRGIISLIQKETGSYETLQRKIQESISKLREYRTAIISAAVTGKIDVRNKET